MHTEAYNARSVVVPAVADAAADAAPDAVADEADAAEHYYIILFYTNKIYSHAFYYIILHLHRLL